MRFVFWLALPAALAAQTRTMTLREAVAAALEQSPEVVLARLDERKATLAAQEARDPFVPKVFAGSGLAYSNGYPMGIDGAAPSIFQARAVGSIYNSQQKYLLAQARENQRGASLDTQGRREEAVWRTAALFLEAERLARISQAARRQVESLDRVTEAVAARVRDGRELSLEERRARLDLAKARQRADALEADAEHAERSLAAAIGLGDGARVRAAGEERTPPKSPGTEEAAAQLALEDNREIRRLESSLLASQMEAHSHRASRMPKIDLVAQYALFAKFNKYEDFFRSFQRHNGQLGVSFTLPLTGSPAASARAAAAETDVLRLRTGVNRTRTRIALDARRSFQEFKKAETAREVARLDLDLERETVSIRLAQMQEGRATLRQVEQARFAEHEKWIAFLDAQFTLERARLDLVRRTGGLLAALR
ncbi:MAG: TolC family protein [Acidobacteria bacterium]|nr:TolC family protein [Acidobacteriota bacterium]